MTTLKVFSYGGGVQSTAALVLAAQGKIDYKTFLFCNVGDDSEDPATLEYVHSVAMPYAQAHNIAIIELSRNETLLERITGERNRGYVIPAYTETKDGSPDGGPGRRSCTADFKVAVVARWLKEHGATKNNKAIVALGISLDEAERANYNTKISCQIIEYPLLDLRMDRQQCLNSIASTGLPIPPKSSCYFCPYHSVKTWQEMRTNRPELFKKACDLEKTIQVRQRSRNLPMVYLTRKMKLLEDVTNGDFSQPELFDGCESGYCFI